MAIKQDGFPQKRNVSQPCQLTICDWYGDLEWITDRSAIVSEPKDTPDNVIGCVGDAHITAADAERIIEVLQYMIGKDRN